jgi:SAM-dependent methyltransferase
MDWGHGYFTQGGYSFGYYPETMPARLHWAALVQGHAARSSHFRYLDAGCGQGLNLILAAIAHPESEFVGIDFMPRHIAHCRQLSGRLGLDNVTFIEGDFSALAEDHAALGQFDYAVCHGIATWIAPEVRTALMRLIGRVLVPGGVLYNSYNTYPGWLATAPLQQLVLLEQERHLPDDALSAARKTMTTIVENAPALAAAAPGLKSRLDTMEGQDASYLLQEYNNDHWQPMFVSQMIQLLAQEKLDYLGSATLSEAFPAPVPNALRPVIEQERSVKVREQLRDYAINQGFRRDLYVKGHLPLFGTAQDRVIHAQRFVANPLTARPADGEPYKLKAGGVELNGQPAFYNQLLDRMAQSSDGCTIGDLIAGVPDQAHKNAVVETVSMLLHGGWALPQSPAPPRGRLAIVRELAATVGEGAPYRFLPLPRTGSAVALSDIDWLILDAAFEDTSPEGVTEGLLNSLQALNRVLKKNGEDVTSRDELRSLARVTADDFLAKRWPYLQEQMADPD